MGAANPATQLWEGLNVDETETIRNVRGNCGHNHRTIEAAVRCKKRDQRDCSAQGGYSDRTILAVEGDHARELTEDEYLYSVSDLCDRRAV
jgi:hypothetical protein